LRAGVRSEHEALLHVSHLRRLDNCLVHRYRSRYRSRYHIASPANQSDTVPQSPVRAEATPSVPRERQHRVTIKEIAQMTGVSAQTVSRVINNRPDVSPETRRAVEAVIEEHGFQPSAVARSLVQRRSQMLGVIAAGLKYFGVAQTVNGIAEAAEAAGYSIILKELGSFDLPDISPVVDFFVAHRVEGIIFAPPQMGANITHLQESLPRSTPPVVFLKAEPSPSYPTIGIDNIAAARMATEHLVRLGRTRVAHLGGPLEWREARDRRDGWLAALTDAGLRPGPVATGDWTSASGAAAFEQMLEMDPAVDALFAASDQMALGALHVANARGMRIPEQLAVVGFDGLPESAQFTPSLTTVRQPLTELGATAVRELIEVINAEAASPAGYHLLPVQLVIGESAPVPAVPAAPADPAGGAKPAGRRGSSGSKTPARS
jgi:DNA-binding LacI/PurR family transcriptional regulator